MAKANIAIVGAGQFGSRHLQGIALIDQPICVYVVDPSQSSLDLSRQRYYEAKDCVSSSTKDIYFMSDISALPRELDIVVIATNSIVRREVTESLIRHHSIRHIILEKFLFPKVEDYDAVGELIRINNIKVWVNCPRRLWQSYRNVKELLAGASHINVVVSGSNIGLGSNGIHFLDIFSYLTDTKPEQIMLSELYLDDKISSSKREGYIEFTGTLYGSTKQGHLLSVTSFAERGAPLTVFINSDKSRLIIKESEQRYLVSNNQADWMWMEEDFQVEYQSSLTDKIVSSLLNNDSCALTTYNESSKLHNILLRTFLKHMSTIEGKDVVVCRIT